MTFDEVYNNIIVPCATAVGGRSTYYQWPVGSAPKPPYVIYYYPASDDLAADNSNYVALRPVYIELYTDNKDFAAEAAIEGTLAAAGVSYLKTETPLDDESMFMVLYETEVIING